jgi:hypothetical protein
MTLDENRRDLERHARDFATRAGFTYTVLDPASRAVIGCLYIYPDNDGDHDAAVTSWVRASHRELDGALRELVSRWLAESWPFQRVAYATAPSWRSGRSGGSHGLGNHELAESARFVIEMGTIARHPALLRFAPSVRRSPLVERGVVAFCAGGFGEYQAVAFESRHGLGRALTRVRT